MNVCSNTSHQDTSLTTICCFERVFFNSFYLYEPLFVFITECEFGITDTEWTPSIERRRVSGLLTHRSVNSNLIIINHNF